MNAFKITIVLMLAAAGFGCAMKVKILDAQAVSMTHFSLKEGEALKETGPVSGEFCSDAWSDKGQMGLLDESIKHAQKQSGVDFITNVAFFNTGKCILLEGTGQKVVSAAANPSAPTSVEPASKPAKKKRN